MNEWMQTGMVFAFFLAFDTLDIIDESTFL